MIPSNLALMKLRLEQSAKFAPQRSGIPEPEPFCMRIFETISSAEKYSNDPDNRETPFAIAVPSVIVPVWNVVLYPQAPGFWKYVKLETVESWDHDPRHFPENAPTGGDRKAG